MDSIAIELEEIQLQANTLVDRFRQGDGNNYIDEAIVLDRKAYDLCPPGDSRQSISLARLSIHLSERYDELGTMADLQEAIVLARETLALNTLEDMDRLEVLSDLASNLVARYSRLGRTEDLDEAIVFGRETLMLCPPEDPSRSVYLNYLAEHLSTRHEQLGEIRDLNEIIVLARDALALCPPGDPEQSMFLGTLANGLLTRYSQLGSVEDLNEALVLYREALELCPLERPDRSACMNDLANSLYARYNRFGDLGDLDEAIVLDRDALALCPSWNPDRWISLRNLASFLIKKCELSKETENLNEAVVLARDALMLCPPGHLERPTCLSTLATCLSMQAGTMENLDEAIVLARDSLALSPQGHPDRSQRLNNLTSCLLRRFAQSSQLKDKVEIFNHFAQLANAPPTQLSADLNVARQWIRAAEYFQHLTTLLAYKTSLRLLTLHLAAVPSLPQRHTVLRDSTSSLAVDAFSACLRNNSLTDAVELLEQGRGLFWSQLARLRSPLDQVVASGPAGKVLADEFTHLTSSIRGVLDLPSSDQRDRACNLNVKLQNVVDRIRELPGLSRFLLPSLFSHLRESAREGPVIVVNASNYGCDALVVLIDHDPVHIPLSIKRKNVRALSRRLREVTMLATSGDVRRDLGLLLRDLWDDVVSPIVDFLQKICPSQSRIWWCPTAEFTPLPLHAAGPYRRGQQNLSDIYISSYTPSLAALIRARRHAHPHSTMEKKHFIAIGQATPPGQRKLPSVSTELANIGQRIDGTAMFTCVEDEASCIARVVEELGKNEWVHLACHGIPNPEQPFESGFALHDEHFTIARIVQCDLQSEFAYLSACHTAIVDRESPDEVIHLASAMQFAGFRSVIGTMWAVDDAHTNRITSVFYDGLIGKSGRLDYTRAAVALNRTMKRLGGLPLDQRVLYIHLGA